MKKKIQNDLIILLLFFVLFAVIQISFYNNKLRSTYMYAFMYTIMCRVSEPYNNSTEEEIKEIEKSHECKFHE